MKAVVFNLGCKVNQYDADSVAADLSALGFEVSEKPEVADLYVLNTCAVTAEAERKSRQAVARLGKLNPHAPILVCGCASQNSAEQFSGKPGVRFVSGVAKKAEIAEIAAQMLAEKIDFESCVSALPDSYEYLSRASKFRTRAYVKVQDGCNNFCSYCLVPYLRGRSRSRSLDDILAEIRALPDTTREIVLIGINLSAYGKDTREHNLADLVAALSDVPARIRLGSLEAGVITDEFLEKVERQKNFCPHFHLSLQSGSQSVLKKMNRHYSPEEFSEKLDNIRRVFPDAGIYTDVIAGFPTETDDEFWESYEFCKRAGFSDMHCFPYSPRKGTVAARLPLLPQQVVERRNGLLVELALQLKMEFLNANLGKPQRVLIEDEEDGVPCGYSDNYVKCYVEGATAGEIVEFTPYRIWKEGVK